MFNATVGVVWSCTSGVVDTLPKRYSCRAVLEAIKFLPVLKWTLFIYLFFQNLLYLVGRHNTKAEECTTPRIAIGSRNIKILIGGGGLPRNQK